jgi:hypothetical protein
VTKIPRRPQTRSCISRTRRTTSPPTTPTQTRADPQSVMYAELAVYGLSRLIPSPSDSPTAGPEDFDFLLETVEKIDADAVRQLLVQALLHLAASDFRASPVALVALDLHRRGEES